MSLALDERKQFPSIRDMALLAAAELRRREEAGFVGLIPYEEWDIVIEHPSRTTAGQAAIRKAGEILLEERNLMLVNRILKGYEIVLQDEHHKQSRREGKRGLRRLKKSAEMALRTDLDRVKDASNIPLTIEQQNRAVMVLTVAEKLSQTKKIPPVERLAIPSGAELVKILTA